MVEFGEARRGAVLQGQVWRGKVHLLERKLFVGTTRFKPFAYGFGTALFIISMMIVGALTPWSRWANDVYLWTRWMVGG